MKRGFGGILAVAVATLLVCCSADTQQEQDGTINNQHPGNRFEGSGHKTRNSDALGGGLVRGTREARHLGLLPFLLARRYELSPYKNAEYGSLLSDVYPKRNFDEIDRSDLDPFVYKRNYDETDQSQVHFPYATKRFLHFYGPNNLDSSSFDKKRYRPDYPMDEIDLSHFPIGSKRSMDLYPLLPRLR